MPLTTIELCRLVPSVKSSAKVTNQWLQQLVLSADLSIKSWCRQDIELQARTEYYDGNNMPQIVLRQFPVWSGTTTVAAASSGFEIPTDGSSWDLNVATTLDDSGGPMFDPANRDGQQPCAAVQTGAATWTTFTYSGTTPTSLTGCVGGSGTLSSQMGLNSVSQPAVWFDPTAYAAQAPSGVSPYASGQGPFGPQTLQIQGVNFMVDTDREQRKSYAGTLRRIGGFMAAGFIGSYPSVWGGNDKLSSYRLPCWPRGYRNIKVCYSSGYATVPYDVQNVATKLVAAMVRNMPMGSELSSANLGAWSYSVLTSPEFLDLDNNRSVLSRYRDISW